MLLVIIGHAGLSPIARNPNEPVISLIESLIYSFHMPLFMAISGYLFYHVSQSRPKSYSTFMLDKINRLGVPYLFFTVATLAIKPLFNSVVNRPTSFGISELIHAIVYPSDNPLGELWFVATLFGIFLISPMFKYAMKNIYTKLLVLVLLTVMHYCSFSWGGILAVNTIMAYIIWFYIGILCSQLNIKRIFSGIIRLSLLIVIFSLLFYISISYEIRWLSLVLTLAGCAMSVSLAVNLDNVYPKIFSLFRNYTYQVFLLGIFFQIGFKIIYQHTISPNYYAVCYIVCIMFGLYIPVFISKTIQRINIKFLNPLIGLK